MKIEIYALLEPGTDEVRYVGKAKDSAKRLKTHLADSRRRHTPVYCWIRKLLADGKMPIVKVLEVTDESLWCEREKAHISLHKSSRLLNLAEGGDEPFCSTETRAQNGRNVARAIQADPKRKRLHEIKLMISRSLKLGYCSEATKEKLRYAAKKRPDLFGCWANV